MWRDVFGHSVAIEFASFLSPNELVFSVQPMTFVRASTHEFDTISVLLPDDALHLAAYSQSHTRKSLSLGLLVSITRTGDELKGSTA